MTQHVDEKIFQALLDRIDGEKAARAEKMPTEWDALLQMQEARQRLEEMGWRSISYAPKDGTMFAAIESGSTGIHRCTCEFTTLGQLRYWIHDGDLWPAHPILWRPIRDDDPVRNV